MTFWYYAHVESYGAADKVGLYVWLDNVKQTGQLWGPKPTKYKTWTQHSATFNKVGAKGKKLSLEVFFDTVDSINNTTLGVLVDDLKIEHSGCQ